MAELDTETQFSQFNITKAILLTNTVISKSFDSDRILEFDPKHKSGNFPGFPYIVINIPTTDTDSLTLSHETTLKAFDVQIILRLEYLARDKVRGFVNAIVSTIEGAEETYRTAGYYTPLIDVDDIDPNTVIDQKELVEVIFSLKSQAGVTR